MNKAGFFFSIIFVLNTLSSFAEDFKVIPPNNGPGNHAFMIILNDSSIVTLSTHNYIKSSTGGYDSVQILLMRHGKNGELMYQKMILDSLGFQCMPTGLQYCDDKIFICGYIKKGNYTYSMLIRMDVCFEVEKSRLFKYILDQSNKHYFNSIHTYSDSELLVNAIRIIPSDTGFNTTFLIDKNLNIKWHQTFIGGGLNFIHYTSDNIILWGTGYFPRTDNNQTLEAKRNMILINRQGQITQQLTKNEHIDGAISFGWDIAISESNKFCIVSESNLSSNYLKGKLFKIRTNGAIILENELFIYKEENCQMIRRSNDNRFIVISHVKLNIDSIICNAYLIDSNLNIIRKKRLLPQYACIQMSCGSIYNQGLLLGGTFRNAHDVGNSIIYHIDTFLNVSQKPDISSYSDSLCVSWTSGFINLKSPEIINLDSFNFRKNVFHKTKLIDLRSKQFELYPNPNHGEFNIVLDKTSNVDVNIYNSLGGLIFNQSFDNQSTFKMNILNIQSGIYFIQLNVDGLVLNKQTLIVK